MNVEPSGSTSVLSFRLAPEAGPEIARLELFDGDQSLNFMHVGLADLNLGKASSPYETRDPACGLASQSAVDAIASMVTSHVGPQRPLYLRFGRPSGGLPMLPWERWLSQAINAPIVRWPYLPVRSAPVGDQIEIAICGSVPRAKEEFHLTDLVRSSVRQLGEFGRRVRFHLFVDDEREQELRSQLGAEVNRAAIEVVPAASAERFGTSRRSGDAEEEEPSTVESPWLRWLLDAAPPRLDLVLFLCHGYLANGRGALAFAESPLKNSDPHWSRFVGRRQLVSFLDICGARALALSSPPSNWSVSGLLALADEVARQRPGPVICHDFEADPGGEALGGALSTVLRAEGAPRPFQLAPSIAVYASMDLLDWGELAEARVATVSDRVTRILAVGPDRSRSLSSKLYRGAQAAAPGEPVHGVEEKSESVDEEAAMSATLSPGAFHPRWKVAGRRVLERHAAALATQSEAQTSLGRAAQEGRARALSFVAEVVDEPKE